ncbi:AI-2E family transporter [uncultured Alloprevotella sp.]|uniref:AI-2E family transporter n=1 Tax=uncultured Alloprevotella sp. TaxID=1283315 RepID=UPI002605F6B5|nr:AI-2E family transporter [uncultured Alloprevotella sp.]
MMKKEITFDRFIRGALVVGGLLLAGYIISYLSTVLLPFFVAVAIAYLLFPIVRFLQYKCKLKNRILSIFVALTLVLGTFTALAFIIVPPFLDEFNHMQEVAINFLKDSKMQEKVIPPSVLHILQERVSEARIEQFLSSRDVQETVKKVLPKAWDVIWSTAGVVLNLLASLIGLLYLFFLLKDYERYAYGWINFVPHSRREIARQLVGDIKQGMNGYFRGQALVALSNCVMFSVGFWILGFPIPVGLGCFIGLISFVPYLQVIGFVPAFFLALLHAAETEQSFWLIFGGVFLVYIVVQVLQDTIVTPHVMGKIMGLSPAVILLSLSVWGYILGIVGLIIALPVTTLMISYYRRYVIGNEEVSAEESTQAPAEEEAQEPA